MRKLIFVLTLCATLFTISCESNNTHTAEPKLSLKSPSLVLVEAIGLNFQIKYEIENLGSDLTVDAISSEAWLTITDKSQLGIIAVHAEANTTDEQRDAIVTITHHNSSVKVTFRQEAQSIDADVVFTAVEYIGLFYGTELSPSSDNYFLWLSDKPFNEDASLQPNASYYCLDLYGAKGQTEAPFIPYNGVYTFDLMSSGKTNTISELYSCLYKTDSEGRDTTFSFTDATVTISDNEIILQATFQGGDTHYVVYRGDLTMRDDRKNLNN